MSTDPLLLLGPFEYWPGIIKGSIFLVKKNIQAIFGTTTSIQDLASLMLHVSHPRQVVLDLSMFWRLTNTSSKHLKSRNILARWFYIFPSFGPEIIFSLCNFSMTGRVTVVGELWGRRRVIPGKAIPPSPRDPSFIVNVHLNCLERHSLK